MFWLCGAGSGVEKPIGEAVLQVDMLLGKERKVNVRGKTTKSIFIVLLLQGKYGIKHKTTA